jgi:hypothetical protein
VILRYGEKEIFPWRGKPQPKAEALKSEAAAGFGDFKGLSG